MPAKSQPQRAQMKIEALVDGEFFNVIRFVIQ
jgi:hypothetical protein